MGIGNGMGHIISHIVSKMDSTTNLNSILCVDSQQLSININPLRCIITKYLSMLKFEAVESLATQENIEFCVGLVEFMYDNSIVYDANCETKCAGAVYYLIVKLGLTQGVKKSAIAVMMDGIYQAIMMGPYNTLMTPVCQSMLPVKYRA
jgi:hypothetical protein